MSTVMPVPTGSFSGVVFLKQRIDLVHRTQHPGTHVYGSPLASGGRESPDSDAGTVWRKPTRHTRDQHTRKVECPLYVLQTQHPVGPRNGASDLQIVGRSPYFV
jgi:hypothetical protein